MTYCRWSDDDYESDVYVFQSEDGYMIHIASARYILKDFAKPANPPIELLKTNRKEYIDQIIAVNHAWSDALSNAPHVLINLPYAGESWVMSTPGSAAEFLTKLSKLGYHVPAYAISALLEEQVELDLEDANGDPEI